MKNKLYLVAILLALFTYLGCEKNINSVEVQKPNNDGGIETLTVGFNGNKTKVSFEEQTEEGLKTAWEVGDSIKIYENTYSGMNYVATFKAKAKGETVEFEKTAGVGLTAGNYYKAEYGQERILPVTQNGNGTLAHLDDALYMTAEFEGGDALSFMHKRSFLTIVFKSNFTPASITFINDFIADKEEVTLNLQNMTPAGEIYTAYMAIQPNAVTGRTLNFTFTSSDKSQSFVKKVTAVNKKYKAGSRYTTPQIVPPIVVADAAATTNKIEDEIKNNAEKAVAVEVEEEVGADTPIELPAAAAAATPEEETKVEIDLTQGIKADETLVIEEKTDDEAFNGQVEVAVPADNKGNLEVNLPNATVGVSGNINTLIASTAQNTIKIINKDTEVLTNIDTLVVKKGNVEVYGCVHVIKRHEDNTDSITMIEVFPGGYVGDMIGDDFERHTSVVDFSLEKDRIELFAGEDENVGHYDFIPSDATNRNLIWTTSDSTVATVSKYSYYWRIETHSVGEAMITATTEDGGFKDSCLVVAKQPTITVDLNEDDTISLMLQEEYTLYVDVDPYYAPNRSVNWKIDNENVVKLKKVDGHNCTMTAVAEGTAIITVTAEDGGASASCMVTVKDQSQTGGVDDIDPDTSW